MAHDDKAHRLLEHLQVLLEAAEGVDKRNPALTDKLSAQEVRVLRCVGNERCCIMTGIADAIRLSMSSVTGLIDRLVEKKLVKRERGADDRRIVQVELTDEGRELHQAATAARVEFARDMLKGLSAEEQESLIALFGKISDRLEKAKG